MNTKEFAILSLSRKLDRARSGVDLTATEDVFKGDVKDLVSDPVKQLEACKKPVIRAIKEFPQRILLSPNNKIEHDCRTSIQYTIRSVISNR